jgi:hypothetical protein
MNSVAQTIYVPLNDRIYDYLDRMETKRYIPVVLEGTRPMTRSEIARDLAQVSQHLDKLSRTDRDMYEFFCVEFKEELESQCGDQATDLTKLVRHKWIDPWLPDMLYANGRNLLSVTSDVLSAYFDPIFLRSTMSAHADSLDKTEKVNQETNGMVIWGTVGEHLGFFSDVRDTRESGTRNYPYRLNMTKEGLGFVQANGSHLYHDETRASMVFQWKYLTLQYGKDSNRWGPGKRGQLALSDNATSYDQFKLQFSGARWKLTSLTAFLKHYSKDYFYGDYKEKTMAAHRLEFAPFTWCDVGVHETIIYAGREIEPAYLNPVMFYRSAEHYLGDRDNATMGMDVELKVLPGYKFYGELFVDDITTGKLGSGFYGNKYAYLTGLYCVDVLGLANLDFYVEYARIRPFTYTHNDDITSYRHFSTVMGHWSGPHSDDLYCELSYKYSRRLEFKSFFELNRHGYNTPDSNVGGSIFLSHRSLVDPDNIDFFARPFETTKHFNVSGSYEILRNCFIRVDYHYILGDLNWEKSFYERASSNRNELVLLASFNY